jgi:hypothetical protein
MSRSAKKYGCLGLCALLLTSTACSHNAAVPANDMAVSNEQPLTIRKSTGDTATDARSLDQQVAGAVADLAVRIGVATDAISVREARTVNWASSALGCPRQDMMYTQAIVPGVLLFLEADGRIYRYHGRRGVPVVFCPDDRAQEPANGPGQAFM